MAPLSHAHDPQLSHRNGASQIPQREFPQMNATRRSWLPAARSAWFALTRHDDPDPADPAADPAPEGDDGDEEAQRLLAEAAAGDETDDDPEDDDDPDGSDKLGDEGKRALDRMKAERAAAKKEATAAKKAAAEERRKAAELAKKVQEYEDRDRSDLEKAQAQADRAKDQAAKAVARSVKSEIRVLATSQFADASDATDVLMRDPSRYVDGDGEIDTDAIEADLADLLERKPHWAKPEPAPVAPAPEARPKVKPDPGQGSRGTPAPVDFRTASSEDVQAELAKIGYRKRFTP